MEAIAEHIVDKSIADEQAEGKQAVGRFVDGVRERVEERTEELQEHFGDAAREVAADALRETEGYAQTQLRIFDPSFQVGDTASEGAAAWNDKGAGNEIVVDKSALERDKDEAYWKRVGKHESVHQKEQAAQFNAESVTFQGKTIRVNPALVEWGAITGAAQPDGDLTPEYLQHRREGEMLAHYVGEGAVREALRTGDIQRLQEQILIKEIRESLRDPAKAA